MRKAIPFWPVIIALAILKFVLPFILQSPVYELQRDEYLYYAQGLHPDYGFLENPPLLSWLATLSSWMGGSILAIKLWPCLFGAATVIVTCLISAELGGNRFAQMLAGASVITGAFLRVHFLFQPNFLDIFFWTLSIYAIIAYINSGKQGFLYLFCFALTFGFLGKYSVLFIAAALVLSLLLSRHRVLFKQKKLYIGALAGLLIISQNVLWQYQHNWPLATHMKELQETQLRYNSPLDFVKEQLVMLLPALWVWIGGLIWVSRQRQWRFIGLSYIFVLVLLILGSGKGYYALGIYPPLLAAGGVAWEYWSRKKYWMRYAAVLLLIVLTWLIIPIALPTRSPERLASLYEKIGTKNKWEDQQDHPLPQDFADMLGWKELTAKAELAFTALTDSANSRTIIFCDNYGQAGSLQFYGKNEQFRNSVISASGSFLLWSHGDKLDFKNMLFVGRELPKHELFTHFNSIVVVDSVTNIYSRQLGDKIILCRQIDNAGLEIAKNVWLQRMSKFRRH